MANVISYIWKVFKDSLTDKQVLALTFILPSVIMLVIGYVIITMGTTQAINLGIVNEDIGMGNVSASAAIISVLGGQDNLALIPMSTDEVDGAFKNKTVDGVLVFGGTFTSDLMKNNASTRLIVEGTDQSKAMTLASMISGISAGVSQKILRSPAPLSIQTERHYGNGLETADYIVPIFSGLVTFVLACLIAIFTIRGRESRRDEGAFRRVIAYMTALAPFAIIQVITVILYVQYWIGASLGGTYAAAYILLLISLVGLTIGTLISSIARTDIERIGLMIICTVLQILFGGNLMPISKFPDYIQAFSYILPLYYTRDALQNIALRSFTLGDVWSDWTALIIIGLVALVLAALCFMRHPIVMADHAGEEKKTA